MYSYLNEFLPLLGLLAALLIIRPLMNKRVKRKQLPPRIEKITIIKNDISIFLGLLVYCWLLVLFNDTLFGPEELGADASPSEIIRHQMEWRKAQLDASDIIIYLLVGFFVFVYQPVTSFLEHYRAQQKEMERL